MIEFFKVIIFGTLFVFGVLGLTDHCEKKEIKQIQQDKSHNYPMPHNVKVCVSKSKGVCDVYFEYTYITFIKNKDILDKIRNNNLL